MIAKDLLAVAENIFKLTVQETQDIDEAYIVLNIVNALLANAQRQLAVK